MRRGGHRRAAPGEEPLGATNALCSLQRRRGSGGLAMGELGVAGWRLACRGRFFVGSVWGLFGRRAAGFFSFFSGDCDRSPHTQPDFLSDAGVRFDPPPPHPPGGVLMPRPEGPPMKGVGPEGRGTNYENFLAARSALGRGGQAALHKAALSVSDREETRLRGPPGRTVVGPGTWPPKCSAPEGPG